MIQADSTTPKYIIYTGENRDDVKKFCKENNITTANLDSYRLDFNGNGKFDNGDYIFATTQDKTKAYEDLKNNNEALTNDNQMWRGLAIGSTSALAYKWFGDQVATKAALDAAAGTTSWATKAMSAAPQTSFSTNSFAGIKVTTSQTGVSGLATKATIYGAVAVGAADAIYDTYRTYEKTNGDWGATAKTAAKEVVENGCAVTGTIGGAKVGTAIGTAICPGLGSAIGGFVGAGVGWIAGSEFGKGAAKLGKEIIKFGKKLVKWDF